MRTGIERGCVGMKKKRKCWLAGIIVVAGMIAAGIVHVRYHKDNLIYDASGEAYRIVKTDGYEAKINVNPKKITNEEQLFDGQMFKIENWGRYGRNNGRIYEKRIFLMPDFFMEDGVEKITYTLQNTAGSMQLENERIQGVKGPEEFQTMEMVESKPVELQKDSSQVMYARFYVNVSKDSHTEWYDAYKEAIESAVIRADIVYENHETKTRYAGIKLQNPYNYKWAYFYELTLE